jgi:hypothetical protein
MFFIDEEAEHRPLKEIEILDLAFPNIPTNEIYKLQFGIAQEILSGARSDAMNLHIAQEENITKKEVVSQ